MKERDEERIVIFGHRDFFIGLAGEYHEVVTEDGDGHVGTACCDRGGKDLAPHVAATMTTVGNGNSVNQHQHHHHYHENGKEGCTVQKKERKWVINGPILKNGEIYEMEL